METVGRRHFLKVGLLGAGFSLADYLRVSAADITGTGNRSAIFIFMEGAPSHQDTLDLKPDAPQDVRGEFKPIATNASTAAPRGSLLLLLLLFSIPNGS